MRKILKLITPLLAMLVLLTACGKEKTKEFIKNSDDHEIKATLYYKDDTVNKFITVDTFTNNKNNISVEFLQEVLKKSIGNISGYSYNVEDKNGKITITYVIDYNNLDFDKAKSVHAVPENTLGEVRKLSTITKNIKDAGFKEK